jgi:Holliday junction DNA helicase RuvB
MVLFQHLAPEIGDDPQYPKRWTEYVGQAPAIRMLQIAIKSAKVRKQPLDHVLIAHGTGGMGKTALALLVARTLGKKIRVTSGPVDARKARLIISQMKDGEVLFYDEVHQVMDAGRKNAEWLLNFLQDGVLPGPLGLEKMPRITVIAATTDAGKLPPTIAGRFPIQPPMMDYTEEEAAKVALTMSKKILGEYSLEPLKKPDAEAIARAGAKNPRTIGRLLKSLRDLALTGESKVTNGRYDIAALLAYQDVTEDGLDRVAQAYLRVLGTEFGGSAGAKALEERLSEPGGLAQVEKLLMDLGLVAKTRSGRALTTPGITRVQELLEVAAAA